MEKVTFESMEVGYLSDIPRLGARTVEIGSVTIALFRTSDDRVFALNNECPHRGGVLSQGIVAGHTVTCPLHNWQIDLASGAAIEPNQGCTHHYTVRVEADGRLVLSM